MYSWNDVRDNFGSTFTFEFIFHRHQAQITHLQKISTFSAPDDNWQITKNSLTERSQHMFNNNLISDVKFSVKDSTDLHGEHTVVIPAHKFILAISSPVFFAMFYGEMAELLDIIELPDCNSESFMELLRFLYCDEVKLTGSNVIEILYLAKKYMIPSLSQECSRFLRENVDAQNVFTVLPGVRIYEETSTVEQCWEIVDQETEEAMKTEAFLDISHEMLSCVLERNTLTAHEVEIFRAVDRWATHKCEKEQRETTGEEKRKLLGDAINLIRFPVMSQKEFSSLVPKTNILPKEDSLEVFLFFNDATEAPLKFSNVPRRVVKTLKRVTRFQTSVPPAYAWRYADERPELLQFQVNHDILIHGIRLFGRQGTCYSVKAGVYHLVMGKPRNTGKLCEKEGDFNTDMEMTNGYYGYDVRFGKPAVVKKDEVYELRAVINGLPSHYGDRGRENVTVGKTCFSFSTTSSESNCTNIVQGQFADIIFT